MYVPQLIPRPHLPGLLLCQLPGWLAEAELPGYLGSAGTCWGYLDICGWGLGAPLGDSGWDSGLHSQGDLNLSCARLLGSGAQDWRLLMGECLSFYLSLGRCPWDTWTSPVTFITRGGSSVLGLT